MSSPAEVLRVQEEKWCYAVGLLKSWGRRRVALHPGPNIAKAPGEVGAAPDANSLRMLNALQNSGSSLAKSLAYP